MTRDDILQMAMQVWSAGSVYTGPSIDSMEKFAALVEQFVSKTAVTSQEPVAWWNGKETAWFEHELDGNLPPDDAKIPLYLGSPRA